MTLQDSRVSNAFRQDETAQRNKEAEERANLVDWVDGSGRFKLSGYWVTSASPSKDTVYIGFTGQVVQTISMNANPVEVISPDGHQRARVYVRTSAEWDEVMTQRKRRDSILEEKLKQARAEAEREIAELSEDWTEEQGAAPEPDLTPGSAVSTTGRRDDMLQGDDPTEPEPETPVDGCAFDDPHFDCEPCMAHFAEPTLKREHERTADHKEAAGAEAI
jgi:hypothetical protein